MELTARTTPRSEVERVDLFGPSGELVGQLAPAGPVELWDLDAADEVLDANGYWTVVDWVRSTHGSYEARVKLR